MRAGEGLGAGGGFREAGCRKEFREAGGSGRLGVGGGRLGDFL